MIKRDDLFEDFTKNWKTKCIKHGFQRFVRRKSIDEEGKVICQKCLRKRKKRDLIFDNRLAKLYHRINQ